MTTNPVGASALPMSSLTGTDTSKTANASNSLGQDAFLKLLVAQLKYQDPMNPADGADFMAQTAQFTMVEKLAEMQKQGETTIVGQQQMQAIQLVGKQVSYVDDYGTSRKGTVESVRFAADGQTLSVNGKSIKQSNVTEVVREASAGALPGTLSSLAPSLSASIAAAIQEALLKNAGTSDSSATVVVPASTTPTDGTSNETSSMGDATSAAAGASTSDASAGGEG